MRIPFTLTYVCFVPLVNGKTSAEDWRRKVAADPRNGWPRLMFASVLHDAGQHREAIPEYREAIRLFIAVGASAGQDSPAAYTYYCLGRALKEVGEFESARESFKKSLEAYEATSLSKVHLSTRLHIARVRWALYSVRDS